MTLGWTPTILILAGVALVGIWANIMDRRPEPIGRPRMLPYTIIQIVCVAVAMFMVAHLVTLIGGTADRPPRMN